MATIRIPSRWYLGCLIPPAIGLVALACIFVYLIVVHHHHRLWYQGVEYRILRLAEKRPAEVSPDQWAFCVYWTWQLHDNYGGYEFFDPARRGPFLAEFDRRLDGRVDLGTIDWIWDQYVEHAKGRYFSENFRPTSPQRLRQVSEGKMGELNLQEWLDKLNERRSAKDRGD